MSPSSMADMMGIALLASGMSRAIPGRRNGVPCDVFLQMIKISFIRGPSLERPWGRPWGPPQESAKMSPSSMAGMMGIALLVIRISRAVPGREVVSRAMFFSK